MKIVCLHKLFDKRKDHLKMKTVPEFIRKMRQACLQNIF